MKWTVLFAFAFAGAFGNLIDRVIYAEGFLNGKVVDFIDYGWSVGNVADIFLTVAGVAIVAMILVNVPFSDEAQSAESVASAEASASASAASSAPSELESSEQGSKAQ